MAGAPSFGKMSTFICRTARTEASAPERRLGFFEFSIQVLKELIIAGCLRALVVELDLLFPADRREIEGREKHGHPQRPVADIGTQPRGRAPGGAVEAGARAAAV